MQPALVHDFPLEDGSASCDAKLRFRLQSNWASYFLRRTPGSDAAGLYVATLNHQDILLFHRVDFIGLRTRLTRSQSNPELLKAYRYWGGEAQLDGHGRFVLPVAVRQVLPYDPAGREFKIISELPVCLMPLERYEEEKRLLKSGSSLQSFSKTEFAAYLDSLEIRGEG